MLSISSSSCVLYSDGSGLRSSVLLVLVVFGMLYEECG